MSLSLHYQTVHAELGKDEINLVEKLARLALDRSLLHMGDDVKVHTLTCVMEVTTNRARVMLFGEGGPVETVNFEADTKQLLALCTVKTITELENPDFVAFGYTTEAIIHNGHVMFTYTYIVE